MATYPEDLPLKTNHDVMWANQRYILSFERSWHIQDKIPKTNIPGPNDKGLVPFMVEAPLSSVEVLEALLKPSEPFTIHTARHVPRPCVSRDSVARIPLPRYRWLYDEFARFQGRLTEDREISFVCMPYKAISTIRTAVMGTFWLVQLHYISIPWCSDPDGNTMRLEHPWALVLHDKPYPGTIHTYENRFKDLLIRLGIPGGKFRRSLLRPGTTPLPECLWDWFAGVPGKTAALPYYASEPKEDDNEGGSKFGLDKMSTNLEGGSNPPYTSAASLENEQWENKGRKHSRGLHHGDELDVFPAAKRLKTEPLEEPGLDSSVCSELLQI